MSEKVIEFHGTEEVLKKLNDYAFLYPEKVAQALWAEGLAIQAESITLVPVDTGRLRASAYTKPPQRGGGAASVAVGYGTDYALAVHERMDVHHPVGQSKYLSTAVDRRAAGFSERLAERVRTAVEDERMGVTRMNPMTKGKTRLAQPKTRSRRVRKGKK